MKKLLALCLLSASFAALGEAQQYQIEVIAFSQLNSGGLDSEQWPNIEPHLDFSTASNFALLPSNQFKLEPVLHSLEKNPQYKILLHIAWRESLAQLNQTHKIHLYGGQAFDENGKKLSGFISDQQTPYGQAAVWQVNGLMSVSLDHYFNLGMNLYFAEPINELKSTSQNGYFSPADDGLFYFHLQENRRCKSGELNYFDYPISGVLVEIFPS